MPGKLPTRIGRYEIQGKLGEGAFGRVYKAYDPTVNRWVAIKVLLATDKEVLTRFKNEAMVAGNLRHKNIVTIYEFGEHEGQPFLAMEFLDGQNLQEVMRSKEPRTMLQRIAIMSQVAEGLDCAHRSGVVHRDVKPANIMVLPDATVKIMDFGIARLTSDREATRLTQEGNTIGTLLYMAPEQFTPNTEVDALCDIFAYGELYYELLAGKHPFEASEPRLLVYKLNTQDPPPIRSLVPDCPDAMDQVLNRLLAKQRDLRYQSLWDLLYDTQPMLIELQQERAASLAAEALELFQQQKLEEANRLIPEILELDPGNRTSYRLREAIQKELRDRVLRPKIEALLKTGREELERRNFYEAIEAFDSAWRLDSTNIEIQGLLENARALQEKSHRAAQLVAEARQALDQQKLAAAYKNASEALLQDPQNPAATRLLQVIQAAIDQKRQQQRLEQALAKAENLLLFQEYEGALAALSEFDTRDQQVGSLIARIRTQKLEHERSVRLQGGMATATELLRNRRLSEAVDHLTRLFADFPETAELRHQLDYARNELAAEERARAVLRIGAEAQASADSHDFRGALDVLEKALQQYDDSSLVRLLGTVMAAKAAWERDETIRTTKEECERLRGEGRLAEAIQAAESAVRSYGADPILVELLRDLERQRAKEKRSQEIREALGQARKLLDAGEFEKAGRYLADAARQFPESPEIQAALAEAQQALRAQERARVVKACAREVRSAVDRADYDSALQVVERALKAYADESALSKLRDSVIEKRAAWQRKQEVERAAQRAGSLTRSGRFSEASDVLAEALQRFNGEPVLEEARQKLEFDWARHKRAQEVSAAARQAKTLLDQDQPQAAADFLVQACARYPGEAELEKLLARAQRAAAVEQACRDARALAAQREFGRALELIEQSLKNWPGEFNLVSLQREAAAGLAAMQREEAIGDALRRCSVLAGQERFADALRLVESSLQTYPGDPGLLAARSEMQARLEAAERLRQRAADLEALNRLARDARSISDASKIGGLREKIRALADQHPNDSEITEAARNALDQLSTMEEASSLLAKRDFAGVLGLSTPYLARIPDHRFFQRLQAEAEHGERLVRLAEIRRQLEGEPSLQRKAQLLDAAFRLYPNEAWLQQEAQVVREKLGLVNSVVAKARRAEESEGWDEALGQWNALREIYRDYPELDREIARVTDVREKARAAARTRQIEQIQQYVNAGNYDPAGELLQAAERELAGDPRLQPARERIEQVRQSVREAKALAADHKFEQASKALEGALARYPADALLQRQLQDVQQQAERQAALRQEAIRDTVRRCDLLAEQRKFADALQLAEASLAENPGHPDLLAVRKRVQDRRAEAERLRQRNADLDALRGMDKEAHSISDSTQIGGLREKVRALAGQYPNDAEIAGAAGNTLQQLAAMEDTGALLAKQDFPAVLAACAKYPDHKFFQLLKSEAERGERAARVAEVERQVREEPDLMRRAIQEIQSLVEARQFDQAARAAANALRQFADDAQLRRLSTEIESGRSAWEAEQKEQEIQNACRRADQLLPQNSAGAVALLTDLCARNPERADLAAKLEDVREAVRRLDHHRLSQKVDKLCDKGKFAEALRKLDEAGAGSPELPALRQQVQSRLDQATGERVAKALAPARKLIQKNPEEAQHVLARLATQFPGRVEISQAVEECRLALLDRAERPPQVPVPPVAPPRGIPKLAWAGLVLLAAAGAWGVLTLLHGEGVLIVETTPAALVSLDGTAAGRADSNGKVSIRKAPGRHTLVITKPGFETAELVLDLKSGSTSRLRLALNPAGGSEATPTPSIASLDPGSVVTLGSAFTLTVTGAGFQSGATVRWNGSDLSTTFTGATRLQASIPANLVASRGTANITVVNPGNVVSVPVTLPINPSAPSIAGLSPASVTAGGPAFSLTITGSGFVPGATLQWNDSELSTTVAGGEEMTVLVPASLIARPGNATVTAINPGNVPSSPVSFSIDPLTPVPTISNLNPGSATAGAPFTLTVTGTGFQPGAVVRWNRRRLSTTVAGATQLRAEVPAGLISSPGNILITVTNPGNVTSGAFNFSINPPVSAPTITDLNPPSTTPGAALTLTVNGTGFLAGATVQWNKSSLSTTFAGATQLRATVPANLTGGAGSITITVVNPGNVSSGPANFSIHPATPTISGITPASTVAGGSAFFLTVTGSGFASGATVKWNQTSIDTTFNSATQLRATVPANLIGTPGSARVAVVNPENVASNTSTFVINPPPVAPPPIIWGISPSSATASGTGFILTVNGSGFQPGAGVHWNKSALQTTFGSTSQLTAAVPANLISGPGGASITVVNPGNVAAGPITLAINPPKADPNAEEIKTVIADFASAMRQLNAGRVVELWPKVPKATRDLLRDVKSGYTFDYKLVISSTPVIEGDQAKVRASRKTIINKGNQTLSETPVTEVVVHLKKSSGKWTITSME